jgi:general nucleoside transport system ATP-binding protein
MRIELEHINKIFGKIRANDDISMTLEGGHIYAILGENGAGKSTLMKILSGYQPPDSGQIALDGTPVAFESPADALAYGIGMLHQEPLDVPVMTVLDNFMLGRPEGLMPNRRAAKKALAEQAQRLGFALNPDAYIDGLTIGERQQLEIVRLLSLGARVLILDEPTTGISADQKSTLFKSLQHLASDAGMMVVLVSHKLEDVEALCDQVYVLRHGKVVGHRTMPCSTAELVKLMFGQHIERTPRPPVERGSCVLRVEGLKVPGRRLVVSDVSLEAYAGQVIGLAGLDGSGQQGFLRASAGLQAPSAGRILLDGQDVTRRSYHDLVRRGVAYAPAGRLEEGLVAGLTLTEHFALAMPDGFWVNWRGAAQQADNRINHYHIKGRPDSQIQTLSGGNQQRALLALLPPDLKLLLLESPTRGLDVESARWVWTQLLARRAQGTAIIFTSPDLDEIVEYSDRIVVFFGGRITVIDDLSHLSIAELGQLIGGKAA